MIATYFTMPMDYAGDYDGWWAGYKFKEVLGYTSGVHTGVDFNGAGSGNSDLGMEIRSVANGVVRWVGNRNDLGFGNLTIVEYPLSQALKTELGCNSLFARYMHQNTIEVSVGQEVPIGQRIGTVGNTGTQWAHLHLDVYKDTIEGGGVHFRYDKDTQLMSYLDPVVFIRSHNTAPVETLEGYQRRVVNKLGVNGRSMPSSTATIVKEFMFGEVLDFKGYVIGEDPYNNGNDIWFVGRYSDTYWYSGAFADTSTHDLPNLSPKPPVITPPDVYPVPTSDPSVTLVVNKKNPMPVLTYQPTDLYTFNNNQKLRKEAYDAFILMQSSARSSNAPLTPASCFRSYEEQAKVYNDYVKTDGQAKADTYSARPGYSEHQTGLAVDINSAEDSFAATPQSAWLVTNAYKYGFILRYPKGKESITGYQYEPWHYRYVGVTVATSMHTDGIQTLEEYFKIAGGDYPVPDYGQENNSLLKQILSLLKGLIEKINSIFK